MDYCIDISSNLSLFFSKNAFDNYINMAHPIIKKNLDICISYIKDICIDIHSKYNNFNGIYISSTYRENTKSPHSEGRSIDISRWFIHGGWYYVGNREGLKKSEIDYFEQLLNLYFNKGYFNQIIAPNYLLDVRKNMDKEVINSLLDNHKDHYHINIPRI